MTAHFIINQTTCPIEGYYNFQGHPYTPAESLPSSEYLCDPLAIGGLPNEILRTAWIISDSIKDQIVENIGAQFLANSWSDSVYFGGLQESFNQISKKVETLAKNTSTSCFKAAQKAWTSFKGLLGNEKSDFSSIREDLCLSHPQLGDFSDTPMVISTKDSDFPNMVTESEFEEINALYQSIKNGTSSIQIEGSLNFKKDVVHSVRILLSTDLGQKLLKDLEKNASLVIREAHEPMATAGNQTIFLQLENREEMTVLFGLPFDKKERMALKNSAILFHEATHILHSLKMKDIKTQLEKSHLATQELKNFTDSLLQKETKIDNLKKQIDDLKKQIDSLENKELDSLATKFSDFEKLYHEYTTLQSQIELDLASLSQKSVQVESLADDLSQRIAEFDKRHDFLSLLWTSTEEKKTIEETNQFRRELYMGGSNPNWAGRIYHDASKLLDTIQWVRQFNDKLNIHLPYFIAYLIKILLLPIQTDQNRPQLTFRAHLFSSASSTICSFIQLTRLATRFLQDAEYLLSAPSDTESIEEKKYYIFNSNTVLDYMVEALPASLTSYAILKISQLVRLRFF